MKCEVCGNDDGVGVASSSLGPMSFCYCQKCLSMNAEPWVMLEATYACTDGDVAEWVKQTTTFVDGKYITWQEFVEKFDDSSDE